MNSTKTHPVIFETQRLFVREYILEDAGDFYDLNSNEEVMRFIRPVKTRAECAAFFRQNLAFYKYHQHLGRWAACIKESNEFIGSFAIIPIEEESKNIQVGYALKPTAWGRGYATELVEYGARFFFAVHQADTLYALTEQGNIRSQHVLSKCGFMRDGILVAGDKHLLKFMIQRNKLPEGKLTICP